MRAPRRRFEIQTWTLFDDIQFVPDRSATEVVNHRGARPRDEFPTIHLSKNTSKLLTVANHRVPQKKRLQPLAADAIVNQSCSSAPVRSGLRSPFGVANSIAISGLVNGQD